MSIEALGALAGAHGAGGAGRSLALLPQGGGGDAADKFAQALAHAGGSPAATGNQISPALDGVFKLIDRVDVQARSVSDYATQAQTSGGALTPGEIVNLTMRCQEFMFQCQLTSNIANRSSDGLQQLFRQQG